MRENALLYLVIIITHVFLDSILDRKRWSK